MGAGAKPEAGEAAEGAVIGAAAVVALLGIGAGCGWLYRRVPTIRDHTNGAYDWGRCVGDALNLRPWWGAPRGNARSEALVLGCLFAAVGFVLGCVVALGRVMLRRKHAPTPTP